MGVITVGSQQRNLLNGCRYFQSMRATEHILELKEIAVSVRGNKTYFITGSTHPSGATEHLLQLVEIAACQE